MIVTPVALPMHIAVWVAIVTLGGCADPAKPQAISTTTSTTTTAAATEPAANQPLADITNDALLPPAENAENAPLQRLDLRNSPEPFAGDMLGSAMVTNGDGHVLVTGVPGRDVAGTPDSGSVVVMFQVDGQWWFDRELTADFPQADAGFGAAVAVSEDGRLIAASAPQDNSAAEAGGAVYLFERFGEGWVGTTQLVAPAPAHYAQFGSQVLLHPDGKTLFVAEHAVQGKVHVFTNTQDQWISTQTLQAPIDDSGIASQQADRFGTALAISSDGTLIIGAPGRLQLDTARGIITAGAVYSFAWTQNLWNLKQSLTPTDADWVDFGASLAVAADTSLLLVGVANYPLSDKPMLDKVQMQVQLFNADADSIWQTSGSLTPTGAHSEESNLSMVATETGERIYISLSNPDRRDNSIMQYDAIEQSWLRTALHTRTQAQSDALGHVLALLPDDQGLLVTAPAATINGLQQAGVIYTW